MEKRKYSDRREYLLKAVSNRRKAIRSQAIKYKGGECCVCGYNKCNDALDFHHISGKDFGLSKSGMTRSWGKTKQELDKCILVCANCHREIHSKSQPCEEIHK
jgi:5-methylcytosine-specific restriction endonuclease McrA